MPANAVLMHPLKQLQWAIGFDKILSEETLVLKEYYEIVDEARPLSGFVPKHADFILQKYISNHETKQA